MKQTSATLLFLSVLPLLLLLLPLSRGQRSDPGGGERSRCDLCDRHLSCNCSRRGFLAAPAVTGRALTLDLSFNDIATVSDDDLGGHAHLRVLSLHANRLAVIQDSSFSSLWSLESLDLSDNQLSALNINWFSQLGALQDLNLLNNPYRCLCSPSVFQGAVRLRRLALGGDALEEVQRGALGGVTQLDELTLHANNLRRYDPGSLGDIWPLGRVRLSLHGPFLRDSSLASSVLWDVSYPDTPLVLSDLQLEGKGSVQPFNQTTTIKRVRSLALHNVSISDVVVTDMLAATDGAPINTMIIDGVRLSGTGRWEKANSTDQSSVDEVFIRNAVVLQIYKFVSFVDLRFLLQYPRKISLIGCEVFVLPCNSSRLLKSVQFADLSDNLLTDLTLQETLCGGDGTLRHLRVFNVSGNALKSLSLLSRLVARLSKLTHLDVSRNGYISMPQECSWPATLRYLNISGAKLSAVTPCLPTTLEVLDLSYNDLQLFPLALPALRELHLTGNKFMRLPPGWLFSNLELLDMQSNTLNMFGRVDLESYRRLRSLRVGHNKFVCSCEFVYFMQSEDIGRGVEGGGTSFDTPGESSLVVTLSDSEESYVCDSPLHLQGELVSGVRLTAVECRPVLVVSATCGSALVLAVLLGVLLWRLHVFWYVRMTWVWLRAKRNAAYRRRQRQRGGQGDGGDAEPLLLYDAFVSYSERDAAWVDNFLVPELENPGGDDGEDIRASSPPPRPFSLCLHKRDFLPGHWITDNIMAAMERSRRTIFVLSEHFVRSEWCRYELDYSHFWLLDGGATVGGGGGGGGCEEAAILVLLEPLSKDDIPRRFCKLHKLMSSTTYLEWPQDQERRSHFWERLRDTLRGAEEE